MKRSPVAKINFLADPGASRWTFLPLTAFPRKSQLADPFVAKSAAKVGGFFGLFREGRAGFQRMRGEMPVM